MWGAEPRNRQLRVYRQHAARVRYPAVLWVILGLFLVVMADLLVGGLLSAALRRAKLDAEASRSLPLFVAMALVGLAFFIRWRQMRKVRFLLAQHGYLICLRCHYPISSEDERGRCPECSEWYQTADVITAWQEWESLQSTPVHGG